MAQLTSRELMFLEDHLSILQNSTKMINRCANDCSDPQLKNMCQQLAQDHQTDFQTLSRHLGATMH